MFFRLLVLSILCLTFLSSSLATEIAGDTTAPVAPPPKESRLTPEPKVKSFSLSSSILHLPFFTWQLITESVLEPLTTLDTTQINKLVGDTFFQLLTLEGNSLKSKKNLKIGKGELRFCISQENYFGLSEATEYEKYNVRQKRGIFSGLTFSIPLAAK